MELSVEQRPQAAVLRLEGRLDLVSAPGFRQRVVALVGAGQRQLVADLSALEFVDSSGLGALIGGLKTTRAAGGELRIAGSGAQVLAALRLTKLDRVLHPYESVEAALAAT
jgi:anti-sigma B factor antagonist